MIRKAEDMSEEALAIAEEEMRAERQREVRDRVLSLLSPLIVLAVWEAVARLGLIDTRFFSMPSAILATLWAGLLHGPLLGDTGISLSRVVIGFLMGGAPGLIVGLLLGQSRVLRAILNPLIAATYPIPKIAILPLILLVFGLGEMSKYVVIAIGTFYVVAVNTMAGSMSVPSIYLDVGSNFGASRLWRFRSIVLSAALPTIFAGVKLAWGVALLLVVAAEFVGANSGIGYFIWNSWEVFSINQMLAGLIVITIIGFVSLALLDECERHLFPWRSHL